MQLQQHCFLASYVFYHPIMIPNHSKKCSISLTVTSVVSFSRAPLLTFSLLLTIGCLLVKVSKIWHWWECGRGEGKSPRLPPYPCEYRFRLQLTSGMPAASQLPMLSHRERQKRRLTEANNALRLLFHHVFHLLYSLRTPDSVLEYFPPKHLDSTKTTG